MKKPGERFELSLDWGMTETDCLKYCYNKGFNFGGQFLVMPTAKNP